MVVIAESDGEEMDFSDIDEMEEAEEDSDEEVNDGLSCDVNLTMLFTYMFKLIVNLEACSSQTCEMFFQYINYSL